MKIYIFAFICALILSVITGAFTIPALKRLKAGQPIYELVENHKSKGGTPTMGGLFFILSAFIIFAIFGGLKSRLGTVACAVGLAFAFVGATDDFIKIKTKKNLGLKPYQKIIFQTAISVIVGVFCYKNGITRVFIPFTKTSVELGWAIIPFAALVLIATTNCVNLTDGLDGLCGGVSAICLPLFALVLYGEITVFGENIFAGEEKTLILLCLCLSGAVGGFLLFNTGKASVFMGDTGSLSLGGFIAIIAIFSSNMLFIPIIGITFAISGISVIVQVVHYKRTKKRVFLMAPLHHHFQLKGYTENKIAYGYAIITLILGLFSVMPYF